MQIPSDGQGKVGDYFFFFFGDSFYSECWMDTEYN